METDKKGWKKRFSKEFPNKQEVFNGNGVGFGDKIDLRHYNKRVRDFIEKEFNNKNKLQPFLMEIRKSLIQYLVNEGLKEADIARVFNINQSTVKRILRGR